MGSRMSHAVCRFCKAPLKDLFVDLGMSPLCESFVPAEKENHMEPFFPLRVYTCSACLLVQLEEYVAPDEIFSHYAYFSSYSDSWVAHAKRYAEKMMAEQGIGKDSHVVEIASNDGYLLQWFVKAGVPVTGVEPAANVAEVARTERGVNCVTKFFGVQTATELAAEGKQADLLLGNNVLAHVPDINDFVGGMKVLLKSTGFITMEFPHLLRLVDGNQFDTIYHEHFSYLSLLAVQRIFAHHGLALFDVEEVTTHGGSLRIYAQHADTPARTPTGAVEALLAREEAAGYGSIDGYSGFGPKVEETKFKILEFLIGAKRAGKSVVGYGAPGKGNTLLNYCGIRTDFLDYTVDRNPFKHGKFCPGSHIPIFDVPKIRETKPDYLFILPWNLKDEIINQMAYIREWGGQFVVPVPEITVYH